MSSLLDKVLDKKDNPSVETSLSPRDDQAHQLPDGSIVYDSTIAAINRVFELNPHLYKKHTHGHEFDLYNGSKRVNLNSWDQILSLVKGDWEPVTKWQVTFLREKIMELAPVMSVGSFKITNELLWDVEDAKLKRISEEDRIRTTS